jgi:hypothetical protein
LRPWDSPSGHRFSEISASVPTTPFTFCCASGIVFGRQFHHGISTVRIYDIVEFQFRFQIINLFVFNKLIQKSAPGGTFRSGTIYPCVQTRRRVFLH